MYLIMLINDFQLSRTSVLLYNQQLTTYCASRGGVLYYDDADFVNIISRDEPSGFAMYSFRSHTVLTLIK